jgi:hypothetical protein
MPPVREGSVFMAAGDGNQEGVSKIPCARLDKAFRTFPEKPALTLPTPPGKTLGRASRKRGHRLLPARAAG